MDVGPHARVDLLLGRLGSKNGSKLAIHDGVLLGPLMPEECTVAEVGRIVSPQDPLLACTGRSAMGSEPDVALHDFEIYIPIGAPDENANSSVKIVRTLAVSGLAALTRRA